MLDSYQRYFEHLKHLGTYREIFKKESAVLDFSTNDYLGLSTNSKVLQASYEAALLYGIGSTGSRLLSGNCDLFEEFEEQIAHDKKTESSLLFCSGFQANISVLSSLLDTAVLKTKPIVFFDKRNHASLYQALQLACIQPLRYKNLDQLETLLKSSSGKRIIVSETLFGMDGDIIALKDLIDLAKRYEAFLYLDEAHATGILGPYGLSTQFDFEGVPNLVMGTFGKALGGSGSYVACLNVIKTYLINKAKGLIYSTAPSPMVIGGVKKAWELLKTMDKEREHLFFLAKEFKKHLKYFTNSTTPIFSIPVRDSPLIKEQLKTQGILVSAVRPPTVQTPRIRVAFSVKHSQDNAKHLANTLNRMNV